MPKTRYFFRETMTALRRNGLVAFAAVSTMFISLFLLGGSLLVQRQVDDMIGEWGDKVEVSVFLRDEASPDQVAALEQKINTMPEKQTFYYETKDQAYASFQKLFEDSPALVNNVDPQALPASFRIKLKDYSKFEVVRARLAGDPAILQIIDQRDILNKLVAITGILRTGVMSVAIIMLLAATGLIGNTVRMAVFARRKEIAIMKLVGATNWFIRVPFLIEGAVEGLVGAGLAILTLFVMKVLFIDPLRTAGFELIPWVGTSAIVATIPWLIGVGVLMSLLASFFAMRRFLQV